jgi:hypothetical protein
MTADPNPKFRFRNTFFGTDLVLQIGQECVFSGALIEDPGSIGTIWKDAKITDLPVNMVNNEFSINFAMGKQ